MRKCLSLLGCVVCTSVIYLLPSRAEARDELHPYWGMGVAPGTTLHRDGFNPNIRYDTEFGWRFGDRDHPLTLGANAHLMQYLGRKKVGGGVDIVATVNTRYLYARAGAGVLNGIPRTRDVDDFRPAMGGLVGAGLQFGDRARARIGVDYDVRFDTDFAVNHTVLLTFRVYFGF